MVANVVFFYHMARFFYTKLLSCSFALFCFVFVDIIYYAIYFFKKYIIFLFNDRLSR